MGIGHHLEAVTILFIAANITLYVAFSAAKFLFLIAFVINGKEFMFTLRDLWLPALDSVGSNSSVGSRNSLVGSRNVGDELRKKAQIENAAFK